MLKLRSLSIILMLLCLTVLTSACDPLATEAQAVVIQITATPPPRTRAPTITPITPLPTETGTPIPGTLAPTATFFKCGEATGQIVSDLFQSKISRKKVNYRVYLPPCFWTSGKRYPSVILLHGSDADEKQWTDTLKVNSVLDAGIARGTLAPMILIMPGGDEIANTNTFKDNASYEWLILSELVPALETNLCLWKAREGRAIAGISRGGFWSFLIGFRHPDQFGTVAGHSPFFDRANAAPAYNPLDLAKSVQFAAGQQPRLWIDAGKDDYARPNIEVFRKSLEARKIDPGYTMFPIGEHNVKYWASHVSDYLAFYGASWPKHIEDLPSCAA